MMVESSLEWDPTLYKQPTSIFIAMGDEFEPLVDHTKDKDRDEDRNLAAWGGNETTGFETPVAHQRLCHIDTNARPR